MKLPTKLRRTPVEDIEVTQNIIQLFILLHSVPILAESQTFAHLARLRLVSLFSKHRLFAQHDHTLVDGKYLVRQ